MAIIGLDQNGRQIMITLKEINIICVGDIRYRFRGDIIERFDIGFKDEKYIRIEFKDYSVIEFNKEHVICCEICREEENENN